MEQKIYLVIKHDSGDNGDFTSIEGAYTTKDKALSRLWAELKQDEELMIKNTPYTLDKDIDNYTLQSEDDGSLTETYIKEMEIE